MDFANLASQLNAGTILPEGIVILTLLGVLVFDLIFVRVCCSSRGDWRWVGEGGR